jgi:hypothetical protein
MYYKISPLYSSDSPEENGFGKMLSDFMYKN